MKVAINLPKQIETNDTDGRPKISGQQICENMKSVLATVNEKKKRKHKEKHRLDDEKKENGEPHSKKRKQTDSTTSDCSTSVKAEVRIVVDNAELSDDDDEWNKPREIKNAFSLMMAARQKVSVTSVEKVQSKSPNTANKARLEQKTNDTNGKNSPEVSVKKVQKRKARSKRSTPKIETSSSSSDEEEPLKVRRSSRAAKPKKSYLEYRSTIVPDKKESDSGDDAVEEDDFDSGADTVEEDDPEGLYLSMKDELGLHKTHEVPEVTINAAQESPKKVKKKSPRKIPLWKDIPVPKSKPSLQKKVVPEHGFAVKVNVIPNDVSKFHDFVALNRTRARRIVKRIAQATRNKEVLNLPGPSVKRSSSLSPCPPELDVNKLQKLSAQRSQSLSPTNMDLVLLTRSNSQKGLNMPSKPEPEVNGKKLELLSPSKETPVIIKEDKESEKKRTPLKEKNLKNVQNSSSRPRRSCTMNVSYSSPVKHDSPEANNKYKRSCPEDVRTSKRKKLDTEIIHIDDDDDSKTPPKLAPIFNKRLPKPVVDPKVTQAKRDFLQSGLPEMMQKEKQEQRTFLKGYENRELFPTISHVGWYNSGLSSVKWNKQPVKLGPELQAHRNMEYSFKFTTDKVVDVVPELSFKQITESRKSVKRRLKLAFDKFPVNKAFNQMKEATEDDALYVEKYRPTATDGFCVNFTPVLALKKYLSTWTEAALESANSDSDFEGSNSSSNRGSPGNVILLHGPIGCGKTSAVQALAQEMNFNVLEVNAGSERNGKKMLKDLLEATKSHGAQDQKKLALILVEDADILLPEDDGFINGLNQMIASSKRPVILTAVDKNAAHLLKYSTTAIEFKAASSVQISKWLTMVAANEKYDLETDEFRKLYIQNRGDLRKTLMEVEFYLRSGGDLKVNEQTESSDDSHKHRNLYTFFKAEVEKLRNDDFQSSLKDFARCHENLSFICDMDISDGITPNLEKDIAFSIAELQKYCPEPPPSPSPRPFLHLELETCKLKSRANYTDYEPMLRQICRTEAVRNTNGRKCRFNHYLRDQLNISCVNFDYFNNYSTILKPH